jgi:hypothetical protein
MRVLAVRLILLLFFAPVATKAFLWMLDEPRDWRTARWSSAGILPAAISVHNARITVFAARTSGWRSIFAVHSWIVIKPEDADYTRYEVTGWGEPIRVNGAPPDGYWAGHRPDIVADISGPVAAAAIPKMEAAIRNYPYAGYGSYRLWPGPNSNTFVASVLRAAPELEIALPSEAIGKDFRADGSLFGRTQSGTGVEMSLFGLLGIKVGRVEGLEINLLGLVAGLDVEHPGLKLPAFGRLGFGRLATPSAVAEASDARR